MSTNSVPSGRHEAPRRRRQHHLDEAPRAVEPAHGRGGVGESVEASFVGHPRNDVLPSRHGGEGAARRAALEARGRHGEQLVAEDRHGLDPGVLRRDDARATALDAPESLLAAGHEKPPADGDAPHGVPVEALHLRRSPGGSEESLPRPDQELSCRRLDEAADVERAEAGAHLLPGGVVAGGRAPPAASPTTGRPRQRARLDARSVGRPPFDRPLPSSTPEPPATTRPVAVRATPSISPPPHWSTVEDAREAPRTEARAWRPTAPASPRPPST